METLTRTATAIRNLTQSRIINHHHHRSSSSSHSRHEGRLTAATAATLLLTAGLLVASLFLQAFVDGVANAQAPQEASGTATQGWQQAQARLRSQRATAGAAGAATTTTTAVHPQQFPPTGTPGGSYLYYVPVIANSSATGNTTYLTIQNTGSLGGSGTTGAAGTATAHISIIYYSGQGQQLATDNHTLAPYTNWLPANPFPVGTANGSAQLTSDQALNVQVSLTTPNGASSFSVPVSANAYGGMELPIIANNVAGITSRYIIYNPQGTDLQAGLTVSSQFGVISSNTASNNRQYTYVFTVPAHSSYVFDPSTNPVPLDQGYGTAPMPSNYFGYATLGVGIGTASGSPTKPIFVVALLQEYRTSDNFITFYDYNGLTNYQSNTLYIPGVFKNAYGGFYTGMTFSPGYNNSSNLVVTVTFYDGQGKAVTSQTSNNLYFGATYSLFTGAVSGLPDGFAGSAIATIQSLPADNPNTMQVIVNSAGPASAGSSVTRNGVYMGLANDYSFYGYKLPFPYAAPYSPQVTTLPIVANGGYGGFYTGLTVQNLLNQPVSFSLNYLNTDGSQVTGLSPKTYTLAPHASQFVYQGFDGLPSNWVGVAVVKVTTPLPAQSANGTGPYFAVSVQTNVQSGFAFYTYSSPLNVIQ